ncbi:aldo/keto reductase, partial [Streptomyces sp. NPDC005799]|uniref:aldo/keto reductase n=1 Tax=Streptomyces sp. NPDC005799 TaxID=3154678 RepID=UPI0033E5D4B7
SVSWYRIPQGFGSPGRDGLTLATTDPEGVLAEKAGLTLIELAVAFVINHPGVTSAIIGPRTMDQLEPFLSADDTMLSSDVLDAIDEIAAPGVTVNPVDNRYGDFELRADQRRR